MGGYRSGSRLITGRLRNGQKVVVVDTAADVSMRIVAVGVTAARSASTPST